MNRKPSLRERLMGLVSAGSKFIEPAPGERLQLSGVGTRMKIPDHPVEVQLGGERLHIQRDLPLAGKDAAGIDRLIVFNPDRYFSGVGYALSLEPTDRLEISYKHKEQAYLFREPEKAFRHHFQLEHEGETLLLRDPVPEVETFLTVLDHPIRDSVLLEQRRRALAHLLEILGGRIDLLPPERAMETIVQVNELLLKGPYRPPDRSGKAGGVVELPPGPSPVIVGDLHANVDNLLKILTEGALLRSLEENKAIVVFLGDVTHPDFEPFDYMDSSILMTDLLFLLKLRFPAGIFILHGNHESFSPELSKRGVPQALLLHKRLTDLRGEAYCEEMMKFFQNSPILALSPDFVACHAGPARSKTSLVEIVNIREHPELAHELTWNRVKRHATPSGYTAGDVRRFRKSLGLPPELPFLVGHYPYANDGTLWLDVGGIPDHHIVYSAKPDEIGLFTRIDGDLVPRVLTAEPMLEELRLQADE